MPILAEKVVQFVEPVLINFAGTFSTYSYYPLAFKFSIISSIFSFSKIFNLKTLLKSLFLSEKKGFSIFCIKTL